MRITFFTSALPVMLALTVCYTVNGQLRSDTGADSCLIKANHVLDEALHFMEKNYYRNTFIAWDSLSSMAKRRLAASGNCAETYDIISWCFSQLNEPHSFIMPPGKAAVYNNDVHALQRETLWNEMVGEIKSAWLDNRIAYITVPWVSTTDSLICMRVADSIQHIIATMDAAHPRGWIIDLRSNTGGNCWPMLAGIGPLLGEGTCAYFVRGSQKIPISYKEGGAFQGRNLRCQVSGGAYHLKNVAVPVIVLTGKQTISSGEIVALAFKGKEQVSFYGQPTAGYTTANATYTLSDNSMLVLTVCMEADRTGRVCNGSILPDQLVSAGEGDTTLAAALMQLSVLTQ